MLNASSPLVSYWSEEEQQIEQFVHRVFSDPQLRTALEASPEQVITEAQVTPRVVRVLTRIAPELAHVSTLARPDGKGIERITAHWWQ